jgi:hypothetical protein
LKYLNIELAAIPPSDTALTTCLKPLEAVVQSPAAHTPSIFVAWEASTFIYFLSSTSIPIYQIRQH